MGGDVHGAPRDARERVAHDVPLRRELRLVRQVLQLAAAAAVAVVVRARRLDALGGRLDDAQRAAPRAMRPRWRTAASTSSPGAVRGTNTASPSRRPTPSPPAAIESTRTIASG